MVTEIARGNIRSFRPLDEVAAYRRLESILWPNGPYCPRYGGFKRITKANGCRIGWNCFRVRACTTEPLVSGDAHALQQQKGHV
jgi:hypothetical protein